MGFTGVDAEFWKDPEGILSHVHLICFWSSGSMFSEVVSGIIIFQTDLPWSNANQFKY